MGYNSASASDRLAAVREKIEALLNTAQEYGVASRRKVEVQLSILEKMEQRLIAEVAAESSSTGGMHLLTLDYPQ